MIMLLVLISFVCVFVLSVSHNNSFTLSSTYNSLSYAKVLPITEQVVSKALIKNYIGTAENNSSVSPVLSCDNSIRSLLDKYDDISVYFDKKGNFVRASVYENETTDAGFIVLENNRFVFYSDYKLTKFELNRKRLPIILTGAVNNEEKIDNSATVTKVSSWASLKKAVAGGGTVEITSDLSADCCIDLPAEVNITTKDNARFTITKINPVITTDINTPQVFSLFNVKSDVILSNIDFKNAATKRPISGGAIFNETNCELTFYNCTFNGFKVLKDGGAIYSQGPVSINDSTFDGNSAYGVGGAIYALMDVTVSGNTTFSANTAKDAGAVRCANFRVIGNNTAAILAGKGIKSYKRTTDNIGVKFDNNRALSDSDGNCNGGAIFCEQDISCDYGTLSFVNNLSIGNGGAVYVSGKSSNITSGSSGKIEFSDNKAMKGAAVYFGYSSLDNDDNATFTVNKADFSGNQSNGNGGSIYSERNLVLNSCEMSNSTAAYGGAVYSEDGVIFSGCNFSANSARKGGAIFAVGDISNPGNNSSAENEVTNNISNSNGGAFYCANASFCETLIFEGNKSNCFGGALYVLNKAVINGDGRTVLFTQNSAVCGGAIYSGETQIKNVKFDFNNNYARNGGAIYSDVVVINDATEGSKFEKNTVYSSPSGSTIGYGGAIYANNKLEISSINSQSDNADNITTLNKSSDAVKTYSVIFSNNGIVDSSNSDFIRNGGAIYVKDNDIDINKVKFENNYAETYGADIYCENLYTAFVNIDKDLLDVIVNGKNDDNVNLDDRTFDYFKENKKDIYKYVGNINLNEINITVDNNTYLAKKDNVAAEGTICSYQCEKIKLYVTPSEDADYEIEVIFDDNSTKKILVNPYNKIIVNDCDFVRDMTDESIKSNSLYVCKGAPGVDVDITDTLFKGYNTDSYGGAIYTSGVALNLENCDFEDNNAGSYGGAIYTSAITVTCENKKENIGSVTIKSSSFKNNKARSGAAVYTNCDFVCSDGSEFLSNVATLNGGAIFANGNVRIDNTVCENNTAANGGAIYFGSGSMLSSVRKSKFISNTALADKNGKYGNGGAVYNAGANLCLGNLDDENSSMIIAGNNADKNGGGIYSQGMLYVYSCSISANQSKFGGGIYTNGDIDLKNTLIGSKETESERSVLLGSDSADDQKTVYYLGHNNNLITDNNAEYIDSNNDLPIETLLAIGNRADNGGGIYIASPLNKTIKIDGNSQYTVFRGNFADYGGGIYTNTSIDAGNTFTFAENIALVGGGAIAVVGDCVDVVSIKDVTIGYDGENNPQRNYSPSGEAVYADIDNGLYVILDNVKIFNCGSHDDETLAADGPAVYAKCNVSIQNNSIIQNCVGKNGGAVYAEKDIELIDSEFNYNKSTVSGGAVYACGKVYANKCKFNENSAAVNGGAVSIISKNRSSSFIDTEFTENNAVNGGSFYVDIDLDNSVTFDKCVFDGSTADFGGAIYAQKAACITLKGDKSSIKHCTASENGGAIYIKNLTKFVSDRYVEFEDNEAFGNGGVLYFDESYIDDISLGGRFKENIARENGGIMYISGGSYVNIDGSNMRYDLNGSICNQAKNGGGIYISGDAVAELSNLKLYMNIAQMCGGGIFAAQGSTVDIMDCVISDNTAYKNGGGIYVEDGVFSHRLSNTVISSNTAKNGAGLYTLNYVEFYGPENDYDNKFVNVIKDNVAQENGGGVYIYGNSDNITEFNNNVNITGNSAQNGGGVYADSTTFIFSGASIGGAESNDRLPVYICDDLLNAAKANGGNIADFGGGIYLNNSYIEVYPNDNGDVNRIIANVAKNCGGGIYQHFDDVSDEELYSDDTIVLFEGNIAAYGGAYFIDGVNLLLSTNVSMIGNKALAWYDDNDIGGCGAAISTYCPEEIMPDSMNGSEIDLNITGGAEFKYNYADYRGGAIYFDKGIMNVEDAYLLENSTLIKGGSIYVDNENATLNLSVGEISGNKSGDGDNMGYGGGVYIANANGFELFDGFVISNNTATTGGGGIYIERCPRAVLDGATISENSSMDGGGLYINYPYVQEVEYNGVEIISNSAVNSGGGVYLNYVQDEADSEAEYTMQSAYICDNTASIGGGLMITSGEYLIGDGVSFIDNTAYISGGGVYVAGSYTGGDVTNGVYTGKSYIGGNVNVSFIGTVFDSNKLDPQKKGYENSDLSGAGIFINNECNISLSGVTMQSNYAGTGNNRTSKGGAIYASKNSVLEISGSTIGSGSNNKKIHKNVRDAISYGGNAADRGGAIFVSDAQLLIDDSQADGATTLNGNYTQLSGAVEVFHRISDDEGQENKVHSSMYAMGLGEYDPVQMRYNYSNGCGAAIYVRNEYTMDKILCDLSYCDLSYNESANNGNNDNGGGAVYIDKGTFKLDNCSLKENTAAKNGGAVRAVVGNITISNTDISGNTAQAGAGIYFTTESTDGVDSEFNVLNSSFTNNVANGSGTTIAGAVYLEGKIDVCIEKSDFADNIADLGASLYLKAIKSIDLIECSFRNGTDENQIYSEKSNVTLNMKGITALSDANSDNPVITCDGNIALSRSVNIVGKIYLAGSESCISVCADDKNSSGDFVLDVMSPLIIKSTSDRTIDNIINENAKSYFSVAKTDNTWTVKAN